MFGGVKEEIEALDSASLARRLREIERRERALAAEKALVVSAAERKLAFAADGHSSVAAWVRANCGRSSGEARTLVRLGRLIHDLPECGDALLDARIGFIHAGELARARANPRCGSRLGTAIDLLLTHVDLVHVDDFKLCVRRWEMLADPDGSHRSARAAHESRSATVSALDGELFIQATGGSSIAAVEMNEIFERFRQAEFLTDCAAVADTVGPAPTAGQLPRTDTQRRFDALHAIFRAAVTAPVDGHAPEPTINIVIDQATFEDHLDALLTGRPVPARSSTDIATRGRCETTAGTLVFPTDVAAAALIGRVRRVVFDAAGTVIDLGRRQRLFTGSARAAAQLQGRRCCYAGCTIDVGRCQIDHTQPWAAGGAGTTDPANGAPMCPRHNRFKNHGFTTRRDSAGAWRTYRPDGTEIGPPLTADSTTAPLDPLDPHSSDAAAMRSVHRRSLAADR